MIYCVSCGVSQDAAVSSCIATRHTWAIPKPEQMICIRCGRDQTAAGVCYDFLTHLWVPRLPLAPKPEQTDPYALDHLREHLTLLRNTHEQFKRRIEEHAAEAVRLEDEATETERKIASIRALIALAGGTA